MKDIQFLEEEIELLKRDNAQIRERLTAIEANLKTPALGQSEYESRVETSPIPLKIEKDIVAKAEVKNNFYPKLTVESDKKSDIKLNERKHKSNNSGIILLILGVLLCLTGVGIILGIPLIIAGIYNISNSKKENKISQEEIIYSDENAELFGKASDNKGTGAGRILENQAIYLEKSKSSFEEEVGIKWFARIGILALVVGIGFFIKYAIDLGWINHFMRVIMGVSLGIGLVIYGEIISKKENYLIWAKTLVGGGLAIIYFVIYGAYHFIDYREALGISQAVDVILLIFVTIIAIALSIKDDSKIIAGEAFFLGYITALLSNNFEVMTIIYTSVLTAGLVAVVAYKKWSIIGFFGVFASYLLYFLWNRGDEAFIFSSIILLFYFLSFWVQSLFISKRNDLAVDNVLITLANVGLFFLLFFSNVYKFYPNWDSAVPLLTAIFCLGSFWIYDKKEIKFLSATYLYLAIFFLILFVPIYFNSKLITIIWAMETVLLAGLYIKTKNIIFKTGFNILGLIVFLKNIFFDSFSLQSFDPNNFMGSTRLISFLATIVSFYLIYVLIKRYKDYISSSNLLLLPVYSWAAAILTVLIVFAELADKYPAWTSFVLAVLVFAYALLGISEERKEFISQSIGVSLILFFKLIFFDLMALNAFDMDNILGSDRLWTFAFVIWVFYLLYIYFKNLTQPSEKSLYLANLYAWMAFVLLILISFVEFSGKYPVGMSIFLAILSLVYIIISKVSNRELFYQGLVVSTIVSVKVLFYDSFELSSLENSTSLTDARILPFLIMIFSSYILSFYLYKNIFKLRETEKVLINLYSVLGTLFAFILIVLELKEYFISIGWLALALALTIVGFIFNKKHLRIQGIVILFITIFKVFIYDIRELEAIYRTISYIVLGIILLLISFIYTKYKDRIKEII